ncbi:hypothetical protein D9757_013188, partial [Collybiopsis confluens]
LDNELRKRSDEFPEASEPNSPLKEFLATHQAWIVAQRVGDPPRNGLGEERVTVHLSPDSWLDGEHLLDIGQRTAGQPYTGELRVDYYEKHLQLKVTRPDVTRLPNGELEPEPEYEIQERRFWI